jgi:protein O-mannosyl-transferase
MGKKALKKTQDSPLIALLSQRYIQLFLICGLVLLCYLHTLDVPFYYDDNQSLRGNLAIQGLNLSQIWSFSAARFIGYFSFAVNYAIHGYELAGYHLINISIHLMSSLAVYLLTATILQTPRLESSVSSLVKKWLPLATAILFAIHPLQIQAVTYIVQRLASLSAMFYLFSMLCYLKGRLSSSVVMKGAYFFLLLVAFLSAILTKQNAVTIPLTLFLIELSFFHQKRVLIIAGSVVVLILLIIAYFAIPFLVNQSFIDFVSSQTLETTLFSRAQYLLVQIHVLANYLFKFMVPLNLVLNYEYSVPAGFFQQSTPILAIFHIGMLLTGIFLWRKVPVVSFGILFYYIAHLVESSIIPIRDFGFDHRTYLPNFGLCLISAWLALNVLETRRSKKNIAFAFIAYIVVLAGLTWQRNNLWRDPVAFFQHEISINKNSFRSYCMLGEAYYVAGQLVQANETYQFALPLIKYHLDRGNNSEESCFSNYAASLQEAGDLEGAKALIDNLNISTLSLPMQSKFTVTLGNIEALSGNLTVAENYFLRARELDLQNIDAISNLAKLKILTNELQESFELFTLVNQMDPNDQDGIVGLEYLSGLIQE